jgi:hypothetical protein
VKYIMERQFDLQASDEGRPPWDAFWTGLWEEDCG